MISVALCLLYCFLATVTCQDFAGCRESYFLSNGQCQPCPDHCVTCISNTSCTRCTDNYHGVTCQHACPEQDCECHKTYGHCTYGCPDGRFPKVDSPDCPMCPNNCEICSSTSTCVVCKPGFHGNTCERQCPPKCDTCDKTTGNCLVCEEGYFSQDGNCSRCQDGCVSCYDYKNCSRCQDGYLELDDGQCIEICSMVRNTSSPVHTHEEVYTLYELEKAVCDCAGVPKTKQPCIEYLPCPSNFICPAVGGDGLQCGAIVTYECTHSCRAVDGNYCECSPNTCDVVKRIPHDLYFCLTIKGSFSVGDVSTTSECIPVAEVTTTVASYWKDMSIVLMVVLVVLLPIAVVLGVLHCIRRTKSRADANDTERSTEKSTANGEDTSKHGNDEQSALLHQPSQDIPKIDKTAPKLTESEPVDTTTYESKDERSSKRRDERQDRIRGEGTKKPSHSYEKKLPRLHSDPGSSRSRSTLASDSSAHGNESPDGTTDNCGSGENLENGENPKPLDEGEGKTQIGVTKEPTHPGANLRRVRSSSDTFKSRSGRSSGSSATESEPSDGKTVNLKNVRANLRRERNKSDPYSTNKSSSRR